MKPPKLDTFLQYKLSDDDAAVMVAEIIARRLGKVIKIYKGSGEPVAIVEPNPVLN